MKKLLTLFAFVMITGFALAQGSLDSLFTRTELYHPGDYGSANYRIPAVITAQDGAIVAVTDKRKYNEGDLPLYLRQSCKARSK